MNRSITLLSIILLPLTLHSCSLTSKSGNRILSYSENTEKMGKSWEEGDQLVKEGNNLVKKGRKQIKEGGINVDKGVEMIDRGEAMIKTSEDDFDKFLLKESLKRQSLEKQ